MEGEDHSEGSLGPHLDKSLHFVPSQEPWPLQNSVIFLEKWTCSIMGFIALL